MVSAPVLCDPETAFVPDHPPEAVQDVALAEFQLSVEALPEVTELGLALKFTVGAVAGVIATVVDWLVEPPDPVQVRV